MNIGIQELHTQTRFEIETEGNLQMVYSSL